MIKKSLIVLMAPILIIQALWVKKITIRLDEPEGDRIGASGNGERLKLFILGDSAAAGVGVDNQAQALSGQLVARLQKEKELHWELDAQTGRKTIDMIEALRQKQATDYDVVLISLGVNDVTSLVNKKKWIRHCDELVDILKNKFSAKQIIWTDVPPMEKFPALPQPLRWVIGQRKIQLRDGLLEVIQQDHSVQLLTIEALDNIQTLNINEWMAIDGYHPGERLYALWAQRSSELILAN